MARAGDLKVDSHLTPADLEIGDTAGLETCATVRWETCDRFKSVNPRLTERLLSIALPRNKFCGGLTGKKVQTTI